MAKKDKTAAAEPEATTEKKRDGEYLNGRVNAVHRGHSAYIKETYGVDVDPAHIFAVYSTRVPYRKTSDQYQGAKQERVSAREEAAAAKEKAKAEKAAEREAAKKAKEEAKAKEKAANEKAASKGKKGKQSSAEALAEADAAPANEGEAKAAKKAASAKGKKKPF